MGVFFITLTAKKITYTGRVVDAGRPDPEVIDVMDVAHSMSMTCRFGGHPSDFYSVAEHSVRVLEVGRDHFMKWQSVWCKHFQSYEMENSTSVEMALLLHDVPEVYLDDAVAPFKESPEMAWYRSLEAAWLDAVYAKFKVVVDERVREFVRDVDVMVRRAEMACLFPTAPADFKEEVGFDYSLNVVEGWPQAEAQRRFLWELGRLEDRRRRAE